MCTANIWPRCSPCCPRLRIRLFRALSDPDWIAINTIVDEDVVRQIIPRLKAAGAQGIVEYPLNKIVL